MSNANRRILSGVAAHGYAQGVTVMTQLASLPIFLTQWDLGRYGQWLILSAIPTYLAISDVGLLSSAGNLMTMHQARGETEEVNRIFNSSVAALLGVLPMLGLLAGVLLLTFSFHMDGNQRGALFCLLLSTLLTVAGGLMDVAYRPFGKYPRSTVLLTTARIVEWLGSIAGVFIGGTLLSAAEGLLIGRALSTVILFSLLRRDIPQLEVSLRQASGPRIRELFRGGVGFLSFPLGNVVTLQGMTLGVGAQLGDNAVAVFNSIRTLTRVLAQISMLTGRSLAPEVSLLYGAGEERAAIALTSRVLWKVVPITIAGAVILTPLGPTILRLWSRGKLSMDFPVYALLLSTAVASSLWQIKSVPLTATNRHSRLAIVYAVVSALAVLAAYLGSRHFGLTAAAGASLLIDLTMIAATSMLMRRLKRAPEPECHPFGPDRPPTSAATTRTVTSDCRCLPDND
jgi:O-antigen/teichoic acid export membrane protein